jgi:hypothetical protein
VFWAIAPKVAAAFAFAPAPFSPRSSAGSPGAKTGYSLRRKRWKSRARPTKPFDKAHDFVY